MKRTLAIVGLLAVLMTAVPLQAYEETADEETPDESSYSKDIDREYGQMMGKKSVGIAALLSAIPGFGAGLYYAGEYPAAISSTVGQATGLGLFLDAQFRTHNDSMKITGITMMGTSWLFGLIYAPLSVHQQNKIIDEQYSFAPFLGFSDKSLYAGVSLAY